jgi:hypothetical protein
VSWRLAARNAAEQVFRRCTIALHQSTNPIWEMRAQASQCTLRSRTKYPDVCFWHFPKVAPLALGSRSWFQTGLWQTRYRQVEVFMPYSVGSES